MSGTFVCMQCRNRSTKQVYEVPMAVTEELLSPADSDEAAGESQVRLIKDLASFGVDFTKENHWMTA